MTEQQEGKATETVGYPMPTIGRIVLVRRWGLATNGIEEHPAIITQVHGPTCISASAFLPHHETVMTFSSCMREDVYPDKQIGSVSWRWPPRC